MSQIKCPRPIIIFAPGIMAGAEKVVCTGIFGLLAKNTNPLLIVIRESRSPQFADVFLTNIPNETAVLVLDSNKAFDWQLIKNLKRQLAQINEKSVLHTHGFKALILTYLSKSKWPIIHTHHGDTSHTFKVKLYEKLSKIVMKKTERVIAVSEEMKDLLIKQLAPYQKISVVENMLSFHEVNLAREKRKQLKKQSESKLKLLFIGRLSEEKGLDQFLTILSKLHNRNDFHLDILGDGPQLELLKTIVAREQLDSSLTFHGFVNNPKDYLIHADLLIMPSLREGLPMTLIESLAIGVPVMASNVGAIKNLITDGHNGLLINLKDGRINTEEWSLKLAHLHNQIKNFIEHASNEATEVEKRFSLDKWTQKTIQIYQEIT